MDLKSKITAARGPDPEANRRILSGLLTEAANTVILPDEKIMEQVDILKRL